MGRTRQQRYSVEFKTEAVRMVLATEAPVATVARELGVSPRALRLWVAAVRAQSSGALSEPERQELARLRQEVRQIRQERDILKKAMAFFARHSA